MTAGKFSWQRILVDGSGLVVHRSRHPSTRLCGILMTTS
jgi:hypothetical protein